MARLARSRASEQVVDGEGIVRFLDEVDRAGIELHSLMVVKSGAVVAEAWWEPYDANTVHLLYSLSKSVTSVAAGIAEGEGLLSMTDMLSEHCEDAAAYGSATIADALRMSVGHLSDPALDPGFLDVDMTDAGLRALLRGYAPEVEPGVYFTYDQLATFVVAKIVESRSGQSLIDFVTSRLFEPLGIRDAKWFGGDRNPGFTGLYLTTESIATFGQLLLQGGVWNGTQLVPAQWLAAATTTQMANDAAHRYPAGQRVEPESGLGYGYQFWMSTEGYHGGGAYSQLCLVLPETDAVVAVTASTALGQTLFDAIWEHLAPALSRGPADADHADTALRDRVTRLGVPAPVSGRSFAARAQANATLGLGAGMMVALRPDAADDAWRSAAKHAPLWSHAAVTALAALPGATPLIAAASRSTKATFTRAPREQFLPTVRFGGVGGIDLPEVIAIRLDGDLLQLVTEEGVEELQVGHDRWLRGAFGGGIPVPFAVRGGWADGGAFEAELRMIEGPHVAYVELDPADETFSITWREPTLCGTGLDGYRA